MDAYIYQAAMLCATCAKAEIAELQTAGAPDTGDSGDFPQGPYGDGGGEADSPQHCDVCHVFLQNPLTPDGLVYVHDALHDKRGDPDVERQWAEFYALYLADAPAQQTD